MLTVLTAVTVMTLDAGTGDDSPVEPVRSAAGEVFGPMETGLSSVTVPVVDGVDALEQAARPRGATTPGSSARSPSFAPSCPPASWTATGWRSTTRWPASPRAAAFRLVPARVVAMGPAQAFARTVTIDAGSADGVDRT